MSRKDWKRAGVAFNPKVTKWQPKVKEGAQNQGRARSLHRLGLELDYFENKCPSLLIQTSEICEIVATLLS